MDRNNDHDSVRCSGGIDCVCGSYRQGNLAVKWLDRAACKGFPLELFFPHGNDYEAGKKICAGCDVRKECLETELQFDISNHGLFGGLTPAERWDLKLRRWNAV